MTVPPPIVPDDPFVKVLLILIVGLVGSNANPMTGCDHLCTVGSSSPAQIA